MTEERDPKPAGESSEVSTAARQRKKRKWDQPAESLISAGLSVTGTLPLCMGGTVGLHIPGTIRLPHSVITNPVTATSASTSLLSQPSSISQNSAAIIQKLAQPKIQDELIAREIVINDAEPTIRYKLTKRQTQEEIQRSTGAVVITRGKFRSPDALPDSEKPLYLHISAGAHLKDTAERIIAVDCAAAMVEDILKQGQNSLSAMSSVQATQPLSTCLYLGFETDPSLNIAARIRGPNDMYINHIMAETGATVVLRGKGSGFLENSSIEEAHQPLHLFLSSSNPKCLEAARSLAENLLDTISAECGASRISSCKVYSAVPPPHQLPSGVQSSVEGLCVNANPVARLAAASTLAFASNGSTSTNVPPPVSHSGFVPNCSSTQPPMVSHSCPPMTGGTCYSGYGGIYPQATPLQQVALALRKAPASTTPGQASTACVTTGFTSTASTESMPSKTTSSSIAETKKWPPQKRKFQELPVSLKDTASHHQVFSLTFSEADRLVLDCLLDLHVSQGLKIRVCKDDGLLNLLQQSEFLEPGSKDSNVRNVSTMPPPKKLVQTEGNGMPPPPPRIMPPPPPKFEASKTPPAPPPPKFTSLGYDSQAAKSQDPVMKKTNDEPVPDTLLMLVEYGDDDDDDDIDAPSEEYLKSNLGRRPSSKPFWAV